MLPRLASPNQVNHAYRDAESLGNLGSGHGAITGQRPNLSHFGLIQLAGGLVAFGSGADGFGSNSIRQRNVGPRASAEYRRDDFSRHTEAPGNLGLSHGAGCVESPNLSDIILGQCGGRVGTPASSGLGHCSRPVLISACRIQTPLGLAIVCVRRFIAQEQVRGVTARRVVTRMANEQGTRIGSGGNEVHHPTRDECPVVDGDLPVSTSRSAELPLPALIRSPHVNVRPKPGDLLKRKDRQLSRFHSHSIPASGQFGYAADTDPTL